MDIKDVAKSIRTVLKTEFPSTKFSVRTHHFSQGESVNISWVDGPTKYQVDKLIGVYADSARYITTSRNKDIETIPAVEVVETPFETIKASNFSIDPTKFEKKRTRTLLPENVKLYAKRKTFSRGDLDECLHVLANRSLRLAKPVFFTCTYSGYFVIEVLDRRDCNNGYTEVNGYTVTEYQPIYGNKLENESYPEIVERPELTPTIEKDEEESWIRKLLRTGKHAEPLTIEDLEAKLKKLGLDKDLFVRYAFSFNKNDDTLQKSYIIHDANWSMCTEPTFRSKSALLVSRQLTKIHKERQAAQVEAAPATSTIDKPVFETYSDKSKVAKTKTKAIAKIPTSSDEWMRICDVGMNVGKLKAILPTLHHDRNIEEVTAMIERLQKEPKRVLQNSPTVGTKTELYNIGPIAVVDNGPIVNYKIGEFSYLVDDCDVVVTKSQRRGLFTNIAFYEYKTHEAAKKAALNMARLQR
jgi:hypothetical protein